MARFIFHTFKTLVEMLSNTEKKLNTALRHLIELEGALLTLAAFVAYSRDRREKLHVEAAQANTVEHHIRSLNRKARAAFLRVSEALHPDPA
jgi:septal ring factor EnvC (AmiA/AmiB activator)